MATACGQKRDGNAAQLMPQIPWGHNIVIIQKLTEPTDALFYVLNTIENNWSRAVLTHQIESGLHLRECPDEKWTPLQRP
jgi:predicted nuclease of restriction endonuclease-like (RecB) superfamily